jgi:hypothetical protein
VFFSLSLSFSFFLFLSLSFSLLLRLLLLLLLHACDALGGDCTAQALHIVLPYRIQ